MDVVEAIKQRRSVRKYTDQEVSDDAVEQLLEAALWAPSAGNVQPWEFVVVKDRATKHKLADAALNQTFVETAPVVIVVCADLNKAKKRYGGRGEKLYCIQDTAAATQNIILTAHALGLATCWVGAFKEKDAAKAVNAPKNIVPVAMVPVGHPAEKPMAPQKRSARDAVHQGTF